MHMPMPLTEQRVYDAADNAYLSEGGYLAPIGDGAAVVARDTAAVSQYRGSERLPPAGPTPDERGLLARFGITHSGRLYCYAQRSYEHLYDALVRAWAAARRPH
ncbi:hypothetical protein [Tahibacter amnicola]|uniref:Uncharacterized protein n=1 Tax=Tahibacter amnicola TaxID=2976241 RepID=A0ABY6BBW8_9GAMM|nr:hypothetical protein [Tahibacter amnicola]UXI66131.1 hypothetical protein N4264_15390 [Tahibacter amnicola]